MDSNDKIIQEIVKYTDPFSILAIAGKTLIRVRCPFKVRVLVDIGSLKAGDLVFVDLVMITRDLRMVYIIKEKGYHFYFFRILLK
jgi:hypothetical protein